MKIPSPDSVLCGVYYGPSHCRQFRIAITSFEDGSAEVRFHDEVHTGDADRVVVEFSGVQGRPDDPRPALREAAARARAGQITWLEPRENDWIVDGDALRAKTDGLAGLSWLTGTAAITPGYESQEMLRVGNLVSRGRVTLSLDEQTWVRARKPWEKNWQISDGKTRSGGQGTVHRVQSRQNPERFGALKILNDQGQRERRYRLLREVQALEYMAGNGTPRLYESNASEYDDPQQVLYAVTEFIEGSTLSEIANKKRFEIAAARTVCERLSETLERLHKVGHKHRDLKPDNVILRDGKIGEPVLVDFGMASAAVEDEDSFRTDAGQEIGNRFLRLPEYSAGAHRDDARSDITQLAGLFYYMITGVTPRVLVDSEGRRPHEREHPRHAALRDLRSWPRLRSLFDEAFSVELDKRTRDLPTLRAHLRAIDEPLADEETLDEIERLARAAAHPDLRLHAERQATLVALSRRFVSRVRDILHHASVEIETDERLSPAGRHAEVNIAARLREHTWPVVNVRHYVYFDSEGWHAAFHADVGQPVEYLTMATNDMATNDTATIEQKIEDGAQRVVKNLVRYLNYQVARVPELRRASGPRTRLTDLREEYPIGIIVNVEQDRRTLTLGFQNNSGVRQHGFSVLLLFPLAVRASIDGIPSTEQEEKYTRLTFEITTPLLDRETMEGPTVHLDGDRSAAPTESHIFFQIKAGDSQFTTSIKIDEVFAPVTSGR